LKISLHIALLGCFLTVFQFCRMCWLHFRNRIWVPLSLWHRPN